MKHTTAFAAIFAASISLALPSHAADGAADADRDIFSAQYNLSSWRPTAIKGVDYQTQGANALELKFKPQNLLSWVNPNARDWVLFPEFKYLWTPDNPVQQKEILGNTQTLHGKDAMSHLWVDLPLLKFVLPNMQTGGELPAGVVAKYEKAAFLTRLTMQEDKTYTPFGGQATTLHTGDQLNQRTDFEMFTGIMNMQLTPTGDATQFNLGFGAYAQRYRKPYALTIQGQTDASQVFDTKFSSKGFVIEPKLRLNMADSWYLQTALRAYVGKASVDYANALNLNDKLPKTETTAMTMLNAELVLGKQLIKGMDFTVKAGYDHYDFARAQVSPDGNSFYMQKYIDDLDVNQDKIAYLQAGLVVSF